MKILYNRKHKYFQDKINTSVPLTFLAVVILIKLSATKEMFTRKNSVDSKDEPIGYEDYPLSILYNFHQDNLKTNKKKRT